MIVGVLCLGLLGGVYGVLWCQARGEVAQLRAELARADETILTLEADGWRPAPASTLQPETEARRRSIPPSALRYRLEGPAPLVDAAWDAIKSLVERRLGVPVAYDEVTQEVRIDATALRDRR